MRVALGAAGGGAEVAEVDDGAETLVTFHFLPLGKAEGDHLVELLGCIGAELAVVVGCLDDDGGDSLLKDGILVHEPDDIVFPVKNVCEIFRMAERADFLCAGMRLLAADGYIECDRIGHGVHLIFPIPIIA
ncbi:Uncharacterised protein [Bacteroides xylanisolvens]|nr:Uncharacterised protein [Bacteroides xylanisolvens]